MEKVIAFIGVAVLIVAAILGIDWLIWKLWCWVLPQVWDGGPAKIIAPGFWLFVACWTLAALIGRAIFGSRVTKAA